MKRTPLTRKTPLQSSPRTPMRKVNRERLDKRTKAYRAYMASPEWKARRLAAIIAADRQCQRCGWTVIRGDDPTHVAETIAGYAFQVHHRTYSHFGNEQPDELECLCTRCHEREHAGRFIKPRGLRGGR